MRASSIRVGRSDQGTDGVPEGAENASQQVRGYVAGTRDPSTTWLCSPTQQASVAAGVTPACAKILALLPLGSDLRKRTKLWTCFQRNTSF
jgi:hypothetical protein